MSTPRTLATRAEDSGPRRSVGTFVKGIGSLLLILAFVAGVPYLLVRIGAYPTSIPDPAALWRTMTGPDLSGRGVFVVLAALVWLGWAWFTLSVLREAGSAINSRDSRPHRMSRPTARRTWRRKAKGLQPAAALVAAVVAMFVTAPLMAASAPPAAAAGHTGGDAGVGRAGIVATAAQHPAHPSSPTASASVSSGASTGHGTRHTAANGGTSARSTSTYTVRRHDTLWSIAQHQLGDPTRFREIVALNPHLKQVITIHTGDVLTLPAPATHAGAPTGSMATKAKTTKAAQMHAPAPAPRGDGGRVVHETVELGDTVSGLAAQHGIRDWRVVWEANKGKAEPGGKHFTNPDHIEVGWDIAIPIAPISASADVTASARNRDAATPTPAAAAASMAPSSTAPSSTAPTTSALPSTQSLDAAAQRHDKLDAQLDELRDAQVSGPANGQVPAPEQAPQQTREQPAPQSATVAQQAEEPNLATTVAYVAGGVSLAAGMLRALVLVRRQQRRDRRPGWTVASTPEPLIPLERAIISAGAPSANETARIDQVLRRLGATDVPVLQLAAVQLHAGDITVHLSQPATLPAPWRPDSADPPVEAESVPLSEPVSEAVAWTFPAGVDPVEAGADPSIVDALSPFPTLVHIGSDATSAWLLNLEQAGALVLTGDRDRCLALARVMSAQLGVNAWADFVAVTMLGFGRELVETAPTRLRYAAADSAEQVLAAAAAAADHTADWAEDLGMAVVEARRVAAGDEAWLAHVLLTTTAVITGADVSGDEGQLAASRANTDRAGGLTALLTVVRDRPGGTGSAVVVVDEQRLADNPAAFAGATVAHLDAGGTLTLPEVGLTVQATGWDEQTSHGVGALMAHLRNAPNQAVPVAAGVQPWQQVADAAGALRPELVHPRVTPTVHDSQRPVGATMLPLADEVYVDVGATTTEDLQVLAPTVPAEVVERVMAADPTLDEDLAAWFDPDNPRAKLTVLGPLTLTTQQPPPKRAPFYAEIAAYLAFREHGATAEEVMAAFSISQATNRTYLSNLRELLGKDPATGQDYIPNAKNNPAAKARGVGVYFIEGMLVDADLFRRLRVRGQARGSAGMEDYATALRLVTGPPFSQLRDDGGTWLLEGDRIDHYLSLAVVDVAHALVISALAAGDTISARAAVDIAYLAAPDEETVRLDKAAVDVADGRTVEARQTLREQVCNRSDDGEPPMDLNPRTRQILARHRDWLLAS